MLKVIVLFTSTGMYFFATMVVRVSTGTTQTAALLLGIGFVAIIGAVLGTLSLTYIERLSMSTPAPRRHTATRIPRTAHVRVR